MRKLAGAMRRTAASGAAIAALIALLPSPSQAADETYVVPFMHFEGGLGYRGEVSQLQYYQGARIGARNEARTFADINLRFGAWEGLEIYLNTAYDTWDRVYWQDVNFAGLGVAPTGGADQVERRKGLSDVWLGGKYALLSEARGTGDVSTWTVETSVKIPGSYKIYPTTVNSTNAGSPPAESPAGTPGYEWLLKTSFSRRVRFADPYVSFFYLNRGSASSSGEGVGTFHLADEWGTFFGTELVGFEQRADDLKFAGDIGMGWRWVDDGEAPANRFMYGPDRAAGDPAAGNFVVKEQGYVRYDGRIGFVYQLQKHARATGHVTFAVPGEHFLEQYPDTFNDSHSYGKVRNKANYIFGYEFEMYAVF